MLASLGCGNPLAVADLHEGERVLDLGSGGGIDVLLSARRVGPSGFAYGRGHDRRHAGSGPAERGQGRRAAMSSSSRARSRSVPLPDATVDVVISNCVINLSTDKPAVLAEMFRVLVPGGRIGISDVVAEDHLPPADRAAAGSYVGCIAGALSRARVPRRACRGRIHRRVGDLHHTQAGVHAAIIRAIKSGRYRHAGA